MSIFKKLFGGNNEKSTPAKNNDRRDGSSGDAILAFHEAIHQPVDWSEVKKVRFAMWLPHDDDKSFAGSPVIEQWTSIYSITRHYWSYIAADLMKTLKAADEKVFRLSLPEALQVFAFLTKEGEQVILSFSTEKGIRFHFAETTSARYRYRFLALFTSYCKAWEELVTVNKGPKDDDLGFYDWWLLAAKTSTAIEEKEPLTCVGEIVI